VRRLQKFPCKSDYWRKFAAKKLALTGYPYLMNSLPVSYARQRTSWRDAWSVGKVVLSPHLAMGPQRDLFERELRQFVGVSFAVEVSSGTAALHAAYSALSLAPGDEIIVPAMTFAATATAAVHQGASVKFADVNPASGLVDVASVKALLSDRTKAVVAVDYAGQPADIPALLQLARPRGITVVADAAHSLGSSLGNRPVGTLADITCFSMFATKNIAAGEGGAVVTNSADFGKRARRFASHGIRREPDAPVDEPWEPWVYDVAELGLNYRPSEMQSALAISQLRKLSKFKVKRKKIFDRYHRELAEIEQLGLPTPTEESDVMWHLFPVRVHASERLALYNFLHSKGIIVQVNYLPVYFHSLFADAGYPRGLCPGAEAFYSQELSLPIHAGLTASQQNRVITAVKQFYGKRNE